MQLRRFGLNWMQGGYEDQPCILMMEINMAAAAEDEHNTRKLINQRNRENFNAK